MSIEVHRDGAISRITLARPAKGNSLSAELKAEAQISPLPPVI